MFNELYKACVTDVQIPKQNKAQKFCEALEAVAYLGPEASREVEAQHAPKVRKDKEAQRLYFEFDDGSSAYFSKKTGVITLVNNS